MTRLLVLILVCANLVACTKKDSPPQGPKLEAADRLKTRGQQIYMTNCTSCHNANPKLPGAVGPDLAGSSLELIRARVTSATYPAGYKPKRQTAVMPAFPAMAPEVEALSAYLTNIR